MFLRTKAPIAVCFVILAAAAAPAGLASSVWKEKPSVDALLPADQAFQLLAAERAGDAVTVTWTISPGYYLYKKRLGFEVLAPAAARLDSARLPKGQPHADEREGSTEIYRYALKAVLRIPADTPAASKLRVRYQGCADAGVCYPPMSMDVDVATVSP